MTDLIARLFPQIGYGDTDGAADIPTLPPVPPVPPDHTPDYHEAVNRITRADAKVFLADREIKRRRLEQLASLELLRWRAQGPNRADYRERESH